MTTFKTFFGGKEKEAQVTNEQLAVILHENRKSQEEGLYRVESVIGKHDYKFGKVETEILSIREENAFMKKALAQITQLLSSNSAQSVVKEFEDSEETKTKLAQINEVASTLNEVFVSALAYGNVKLFEIPGGRKRVPRLTKEGDKVYETFNEVAINLAKILGIKKEAYQNAGKLRLFFEGIGVKPLDKSSIVRPDGRHINTVIAAIIREGHAKEYANYLRKFIDDAKKEVV